MIVLGSLLPALLLGVAIHLLPVQYTTTFVYERPLTESEHNVLLRRFYSSENLSKIIERLRAKGVAGYATKLDQAETEQSLERLIRFRVSPLYPKRLTTTDPATSELISLFKARLLDIEITGGSKDNMAGISEVVTANFESVLPVYDIRNDLKESIQRFKTLAAEIEDNRFTLTVDLKKEETRLEKLLSLANAPSETAPGDVVLQFTAVADKRELLYDGDTANAAADASEQNAARQRRSDRFTPSPALSYLPFSYQIRAVQSRIIDLEETLRSERDVYGYYLKVLELNGRLLRKIEESLLTYYTAQEFLDFLDEQLAACTEETVVDYLKSYIRRTQNLINVNTRVGEKPIVYPVAKRVLSRSILALLVLLMITAFLAVAIEYSHERRKLLRPGTGSPGAGG